MIAPCVITAQTTPADDLTAQAHSRRAKMLSRQSRAGQVIVKFAAGNNMASQDAVLFSNDYIADYDSATNTSSTKDHFLFSGVKDQDMNTLSAISPGGDTNYLTVALQGGLDDPNRRYTAFNMDISLPYGLEIVYEDGKPDVELPQDFSLYATSVSAITHSVAGSLLNDTTLRVACTSNANASFLRASGDLFMMGVRVASPYVKPGANTFYFSGQNLTAASGGHKYKPEDGSGQVNVGESAVSITLSIPASAPFTDIVLPFSAALPAGVLAFTCTGISNGQAQLMPQDTLLAYTPYILYAKDGCSATLLGTLSAAAYNQRVAPDGTVSAGILKGAIRPQTITGGSVLSSTTSASSYNSVSSATTVSSGHCWIADNAELSAISVSVPTYRLRFLLDDGSVVKDTLLAYKSPITLPAAPQKTGYVFVEWDNAPEKMPAKDIDITAKYTLLGDVNADEQIDVIDLSKLVSLILSKYSINDSTFKAADINMDKVLDVSDISRLVNLILNKAGTTQSNGYKNNAK